MDPSRHERIVDVFVRAKALPPDQRRALLDDACSGDAGLRNEIDSLLAADEREVGFLDSPPAGGVVAAMADDGSNEIVGTRVGRYEVRRLVATGGMGAVYEAVQDHPRRIVALKVLRGGTYSRSALRRFERESELLARLRHPHIAQVYDAGVYEGLPYFAMEFIPEARPITTYAQTEGLTTRQRLALFAAVCDAVQHGHQNGVIHRDLKPDNILVDRFGHAKVIDFGVAKATDSDLAVTTMHTDVRQLIGTLPYMSAEQVAGDPAELDTRCDVYALGVVLFELLSGRLPHELRDCSVAEAARIIREEEPAHLSSVSASLRGDLDTIVSKAIEKEKDRRYQSVGELSADVRRFLRDEPIVARRPTTLYQLRKFAKRHKGLVGGIAVAMLAMLVGTIVAVSQAVVATRARDLARHHEFVSRRQAYLACINAAATAIENVDFDLARRSLTGAPEELRGWEWHHLHARLDESLVSIPLSAAESGGALAFADDGSVITLSRGPSLPLLRWEAATGERLADAVDMPPPFWRNNAGTAEVIRNGDAFTVRDPSTGIATSHSLAAWGLGDFELYAAQISNDGRTVALADAQVLHLINLLDSAAAKTMLPSRGPGRHAFTVGNDRRITFAAAVRDRPAVWDPVTDQFHELPGATAYGEAIDISADDTRVAVGLIDGTLQLWDLRKPALLGTVAAHRESVAQVRFSPDGVTLLSLSNDRTLGLWDAHTLATRSLYRGLEGFRCQLVFSPDGRRLATLGRDRVLRIWDTSLREDPRVLREHASFVYDVAISPDGSLLASAGWDGFESQPGAVRLWNLTTSMRLTAWGDASESAFSVAFSPDSRLLAAAMTSGVWVGDVATRTSVIRLAAHETRAESVAFNPTGARLISAQQNGPAYVWDVATGTKIATLEGAEHPDFGNCVAWSPNGRWIAATLTPVTVAVWNASTFARVHELRGHNGQVWDIEFNRDGTRLATASADDSVRVWDPSSGQLLGVLAGSSDDCLCVAFHPDHSRIVTGGRDQVIHVWDSQTFEEVAQLRGHRSYVKTLAFNPAGSVLVSGSGDHTVRLWETRSLCDRLRNRSAREGTKNPISTVD